MMKRIWPFVVCSFASFFYLYVYVIHVMPSAMTTSLMTAFGIQAGGLGILSSLYFYGYTPMQIPAGILYDRMGARSLLTLALTLCAFSTIAFGLTETFSVALLARWIMGITASFGFIGALVVGAAWFPARYFAAYTGMVQLLGCIGAIVGQGPIASLTNQLGWRTSAIWIGIVGLVVAFLIWLIIRNHPEQVSSSIAKESTEKKKLPARLVFKSSQNWWVAFYSFGIWGPVVTFASLWGVPFFHDVYGLSTVQAASLTSLVWIGIAIGGPILGWWSHQISRRVIPMSSAAFLGLLCSLGLIYFNSLSYIFMAILLLGFGIASSAQALCFGVINDINQKGVLGTAVGFTNMAIVAGGIILQPLAGILLEKLGHTSVINGISIYSAHNYQIALIIVPLCFLFSFIFSTFFIKETFCEHKTSS